MSYPQPPYDSGQGPGSHPYGSPPYGSPQYPAGTDPGPAGWGPPQGWGGQPQGWGDQPQGGWGQPQYGPPGGPYGPPRRPGTVLAAAIMTYVGAALFIVLGLVLVIGSSNPDFREGFAEGAGTEGVPTGAIAGVGVVVALVGIALIVLAAFAQRGSNGARIGITVIGGVFIFLQLVSIATGAAQALLGLIWIGVAITLLWVGGANAWFRRPRY